MSIKSLPATESEVTVGARVRQIRQGAGMSVRTLATTTGFSPSFVSQVENGQASPSIASLERIAHALGVTLVEFFASVGATAAVVIRAAEAPELRSIWSRAQIRALGHLGAVSQLEPMMITLEPGGQSGKHPSAPSGETFAVVFDGEVTLTLGESQYVLHRGDAVTLTSEMPYRWENNAADAAQIIVVAARRPR